MGTRQDLGRRGKGERNAKGEKGWPADAASGG